jgi:hypothetical protein
VHFHQLEHAVLLTEEADIRKAQAGPDVHCPYCHARNPSGAEFCGACGGGLAEAETRQSGRIVGAFRQEKGLEKECPHCGTLNTPGALECSGCGGSLKETTPEPLADRSRQTKDRKGLPRFIGIGCLGIIVIGAAILLFSLFSKQELNGTVQGVEWTHTIPILALTPVEREDWRDQIPDEVESIQCTEELRETSDEFVPGAVEVCGTPYTIDEGSGYGEVVQDCSYEIYDDFCSYTIMDWSVVDAATASGTDLEPYWPDPALALDQQAGEGEAEYAVLFEADGESYRYYPDDQVEFSRYLPGTSWVIEVNQLGGVSVLEPVR